MKPPPDGRTAFARVGELLERQGLRLATAESCTGGLLAAGFTEQAGASAYFEAGLVTYSDRAKREMLNVRTATLGAEGAVSEAVAREMVTGALRSADVAVAITGVAGPGGGTPAKPVGTVWIAVGTAARSEARRFHFDGDRSAVRAASVHAALELLESLIREGP
jgi:nicotinamide-nucleotide amidase